MITIGKITHKRIAGSSKSSAMMESVKLLYRPSRKFLMSRGEKKKTDQVSYMKYVNLLDPTDPTVIQRTSNVQRRLMSRMRFMAQNVLESSALFSNGGKTREGVCAFCRCFLH